MAGYIGVGHGVVSWGVSMRYHLGGLVGEGLSGGVS